MPNRLKELRIAKGLSQEELSELTEISQTMISAFERGIKDISLSRAKSLAVALGCTIEEIIGEHQESKDTA